MSKSKKWEKQKFRTDYMTLRAYDFLPEVLHECYYHAAWLALRAIIFVKKEDSVIMSSQQREFAKNYLFVLVDSLARNDEFGRPKEKPDTTHFSLVADIPLIKPSMDLPALLNKEYNPPPAPPRQFPLNSMQAF